MRLLLYPLLVAALCACAGSPARDDLAGAVPAHSPECQLSAANEKVQRGQGASMEQRRCGKDERLEWSSARRDTIKPDFSGKRGD